VRDVIFSVCHNAPSFHVMRQPEGRLVYQQGP
jgi:hypothetical protein